MPAPPPGQQPDDWPTAFGHAAPQHGIGAAMRPFVPDAFWHDLAAFTWNSITSDDQQAISDMPEACLARGSPRAWRVASSVIRTSDAAPAADVVVDHTGFGLAPALRMLPADIAQTVGLIRDPDSGRHDDPGPWEGALRTTPKPIVQTGLGPRIRGIGGSRFYSHRPALRIKARQPGLQSAVDRGTAILEGGVGG